VSFKFTHKCIKCGKYFNSYSKNIYKCLECRIKQKVEKNSTKKLNKKLKAVVDSKKIYCSHCRKRLKRKSFNYRYINHFCDRDCYRKYNENNRSVLIRCSGPFCKKRFYIKIHSLVQRWNKNQRYFFCGRKCFDKYYSKYKRLFPTNEHQKAAGYFGLKYEEVKAKHLMPLIDLKVAHSNLKKTIKEVSE